jgi:hypothetical protein
VAKSSNGKYKKVNVYPKGVYGTMGYGDQRPLKQNSGGAKNFAQAGTIKRGKK